MGCKRLQQILIGFTTLFALCLVCEARRCYLCTGAFPERECEKWPDSVRHGPGKQECGNRLCTTYIRYRPMQHLLIPLGPNKPKATAAPLRPVDFEAVSISRDCVDRIPAERDNKCFTDGDGLGATCFTSCASDLCNGDLRRPNHTELSRGRNGVVSLAPIGPNEFEQWKPVTTHARQTQPPTPPPRPRTSAATRKQTDVHSIDDPVMDTKSKDLSGVDDEAVMKGGKKPGRKHRLRPGQGKRGEVSNVRGEQRLPEDAGSSAVNVKSACANVAMAIVVVTQCFL